MPSSNSWESVLSLADEQWGLVTSRQMESTGIAWSTVARKTGHGSLDRVARGVYRVRGAGEVEFIELRAAWLQLSPATPVWERSRAGGVVSHRSAAALDGLGHLPADIHEFTLPVRKQTRRPDVRLHRGDLEASDWHIRHGLLVTRPRRIAADLLAEREDLEAVGHVVSDALRVSLDSPGEMVNAIAPYAHAHGLRRGHGIDLLSRLLELTGTPEREAWLAAAAATTSSGAA